MHQQQYIPTLSFPTAQEELAAISHRERLGCKGNSGKRLHTSPVAREINVIQHGTILLCSLQNNAFG